MDDEVLTALLKANTQHGNDKRLEQLGQQMFTLYAQDGYPPDMFIKEVAKTFELTLSAKVFITQKFCVHFLEHRRLAGMQEKNLAKLQRRNREHIARLLKTGEIGIY